MTHRSFPRGFKVGRSASAAIVNGTGGMLGKNQRMPMPAPSAPAAGAGGFRGLPGARNAAPQAGAGARHRGTGACDDCGINMALVRAGQASGCKTCAVGEEITLFTTQSAGSHAANATVSVTAQVTSSRGFSPAQFVMTDVKAKLGWNITSITTPDGQNLLMNAQAVDGGYFSNEAQTPVPIQACCVAPALSLTVNATNVSGTTVSFFQGSFKGSCC